MTCQFDYLIFEFITQYKILFLITPGHTPLSSSLHHDTSFYSSPDEEAEPKPPRLNVPRIIHNFCSHPLVPRCCQRR